ncbi:hypothetical protein B0T09DRAFT_388330 [Sordaria sp. MPI-SDFR-AT-0083]|nr:hypothetical protein B0T09DRAFT_388330 [Sordaria sp. MPI-SDFR-AT-0083]
MHFGFYAAFGFVSHSPLIYRLLTGELSRKNGGPSRDEQHFLEIRRKTEVRNNNCCAEWAPDWAYDTDAPLPIFAYQHALEQTDYAEILLGELVEQYNYRKILELIPTDGRIGLSFNGKWSSQRDVLLNSIPNHKRPTDTDTHSLISNIEQALKDLGEFGVLDIADFDPSSRDRVNYRLSKTSLYVTTVLDGAWWFQPSAFKTRRMQESGNTVLPKYPSTKKTAGWNRVM